MALSSWINFTDDKRKEEEKETVQHMRAALHLQRIVTWRSWCQWCEWVRIQQWMRESWDLATRMNQQRSLHRHLSAWRDQAHRAGRCRRAAFKSLRKMDERRLLSSLVFPAWRLYASGLAPVCRRIYRARIHARVVRYGRKWLQWSKKKSLHRLVHSPLSTECSVGVDGGVMEESISRGSMRRTSPRCNMDLLASTDLTDVLSFVRRTVVDGGVEMDGMVAESGAAAAGRSQSSVNTYMKKLDVLQHRLSDIAMLKQNKERGRREEEQMMLRMGGGGGGSRRGGGDGGGRRRVTPGWKDVGGSGRRRGREDREDREDMERKRGGRRRKVRAILRTPSTYEEEEDVFENDEEVEEEELLAWSDEWEEVDKEDDDDDDDETETVLEVLKQIRTLRAAVEGTLTSP